ncbi:ATP-binding protein [Candidatus Regiella endosymbiont of Tuberolachnus salignus]|uniref:ATP-binding protein n=1 Tax=Candidatus Regiella endosymbiont of Tuberolachnus salignus TaxID=3077956 RepID=UPI003BB12A49
MNLQLSRIGELTSALQLPGIDANACDLAQQAAQQEWDYLTFLEQILQCEKRSRHQRKQHIFTRMAGFPGLKTLEKFDFTFAVSANDKRP